MHPDMYWITGPWPGRLAMVPRPRGEDWLADEVAAWRRAGLDVIVSTLTDEEDAEFGLRQEAELARDAGLDFLTLPVPDRSVPDDRRQALAFLRHLDQLLSEGKHIGVHCRQGIGRSALIASSLLILGGLKPEAAIDRVSQARGLPVPETPEQRHWITALSKELVPNP